MGWRFSDYMLVYVKNCIFVRMSDKIFLVTAPFRDLWSLIPPLFPKKVEVLEPPL